MNLTIGSKIALIFTITLNANEKLITVLNRLKEVYPENIKFVCEDYIVWHDDTIVPLGKSDASRSIIDKMNFPCFIDQLEQVNYKLGNFSQIPKDDPGRIRYEPFFRKMYGNSPKEVEANLQDVIWMPNIFGTKYILRVTKINNIHKKIKLISDELELLVLKHPEFIKFLDNPGGTYSWRFIANTNRLSNHSFGMTIDINANESNYWQWDLETENLPIHEETKLNYRNSIPFEIVEIFEKYGFVWGGKWYHYDTMHFEYRPELFES